MEKLNEILLKSGVITLSAFLGAITESAILIICVFILVLFDNVLAIYVKLRNKEEKFDYKKLKTTIEKTLCYVMLMVGGVVLWVLTEVKFYTFFAVYIGIYEFFSVLRHFMKITGNQIFIDLIEYIKNKIDLTKFLKK